MTRSEPERSHERGLLVQALAQVAEGNRAALREVYSRTSSKLFGICLRVLGDRNEAEDALQEIYLIVWRRARSFDPARASPITWLSVIARNRAIDMVRASRPPLAAEPIERALDVPDGAPDALSVLAAGQERDRLTGCMDELEQHQAEAIRSAFFTGNTYAELADRSAVPLGTMKSWIRRGLLRLRECLDR